MQMCAGAYGSVSQGVTVGAKQSRLSAQEGPGHAASRRRGLLLQLTLQGGDLGQREKEGGRQGREGEGVRKRRRKKEKKVNTSEIGGGSGGPIQGVKCYIYRSSEKR